MSLCFSNPDFLLKIRGGPWGGPWTPVNVLYTFVFQLFGISVPIGSRKHKTHNIWKISFVIKCFSFYSASLIGYFVISLAICSPCRKKHKAENEF